MTAFETTFDDATIDYDKSRPMYVKEIYKDILCYQPIDSNSIVLEIGMGTGKATGPVLDTGCCLTGIEPGKQLADFARQRFVNYANFTLENQTLQEFGGQEKSFDLIYAATAFHWIPEEYGYKRVFQLLKPGGTFARFAYHAGADKGRAAMAEEIQGIYSKYFPHRQRPKEFSLDDAKKTAALADKYGFYDIRYDIYSAQKDFTADEYMALLRTYPDHMKLEVQTRKKLFDEIYSVIQNHGGSLTVYYTMDLELARRP
ncbi:MAG: class I SAM-dependent methyltransferase [Acetatifactor sp.]|nr:class I SAM-dependent methyltransferase [Acetatifactor sp.]